MAMDSGATIHTGSVVSSIVRVNVAVAVKCAAFVAVTCSPYTPTGISPRLNTVPFPSTPNLDVSLTW
ncbi:MAG: hypothetical protein EAX95_10250 [Candidatus Thorarchaeota archaeon]|nr:hypothetical protein [Candidatus Thorarchaeota archaeon]